MTQITDVKNFFTLTDKTVFISVSFGVMGNSKHVNTSKASGADSTDQPNLFNTIEVKSDASLDLLRTQKTLLESPQLKAIISADGKLRNWLYRKGQPFDVGGMMFLSTAMVPTVQAKLEEYSAQRQDLVEQFMSAYYDLCLTAKVRLGSLYDPKDYPTADYIRSRFYFQWQYLSFAVPDHLKDISTDLYKQECAKAQAQVSDAVQDIVLLMREKLYDLTAKLADSLAPSPDGKSKRLHSTAVTNLQEFLSDFDLRNIVNDVQLETLVKKLKGMVTGISADGLKANTQLKAKIQSMMESVASQASELVEAIPARKYRKD